VADAAAVAALVVQVAQRAALPQLVRTALAAAVRRLVMHLPAARVRARDDSNSR
jgi:hypothetical protein